MQNKKALKAAMALIFSQSAAFRGFIHPCWTRFSTSKSQTFFPFVGKSALKMMSTTVAITDEREQQLKELAKNFIDSKNSNNLEKIFEDLDECAVVYGIDGKRNIETGLTKFFKQHPGLHHSVIGDYEVVSSDSVQYKFIKSWNDPESGEKMVWDSSLPEKNKVERITYSSENKIKVVEVVKLEKGPKAKPIDLARKFIALRNANDLPSVFNLMSEDIVAYGHRGKEAVKTAFVEFHESHPDLLHSVKPEAFKANNENAAQYKFVKTWRDPHTSAPMEWNSYQKGKVERISLDDEGNIKAIDIFVVTE